MKSTVKGILCFICCLVYGSFHLTASCNTSIVMIQDDLSYDNSHVFNRSPLRLTTLDSLAKGEWLVSVLSSENEYADIVRSTCDTQEFIFDPSDSKWDFSMAKEIYDFESDRDLFDIRIRLTQSDGDELTEHIRMALLPSRPKIGDIQFLYIYDWERDDIYPNGDFSFTVTADDADGMMLFTTESFLFSFDYFKYESLINGNGTKKVSYDADWGEYISIGAYNQFGWSTSDTIYTTDYIADTDILNRIEELRKHANASNIQQETAVTVTLSNNNIIFDHNVISASIYNIAGQLILYVSDTDNIDIQHLRNCMYILVYEDYNSTIYKHKFIKS